MGIIINMIHRTKLTDKEEVVIIYILDRGFVTLPAIFKEYRNITISANSCEIPFFQLFNEEISGLTCFWIKKSDISDSDVIIRVQSRLKQLQYEAKICSDLEKLNLPTKITDKENIEMAQHKSASIQELIKRIGFDPSDNEWIETDLAKNELEKTWFRFERLYQHEFNGELKPYIDKCNKEFGTNLTEQNALALSKLRMRYIYGSMWIRRQGIADKSLWIKNALEFESKHRLREERMEEWNRIHKEKFPIVKTKTEVSFHPGPFFKQCIESVPQIFVDKQITAIRAGVDLKVLAYDNQEKYIVLDFMDEIALKIRGKVDLTWEKTTPDYLITVPPKELNNYLLFLDSL